MEKHEALAALSALAHETRLDIFRLLVRAGTGGMPAGEIAREIDLAAPTLSFHLKELRNAGVVGCRRDGRQMIYSPSFEAMQQLVGYLSSNCCEGAGCEIENEPERPERRPS